MADNKTKKTATSVQSYLSAIPDAARKADCEALVAIMTKASKEQPAMWGSSIVGFGSYHYKYESGREGDSCIVGFAPRKSDIAVYGLGNALDAQPDLAARLGKHKRGKGCLYLRTVSDVNADVLQRLIADAVAARKRH